MESKTSFFNKGIYKKTLKRFFPWSICYGLILLVILPAVSGLMYNSSQTVYSSDGVTYHNTLKNLAGDLIEYTANITPYLIVIIAAAALFAGVLIFSYLFKERTANMMHALPVSREALLITSLLAGLTLLLLPMILAEGITILLGLLFGIPAFAVLHAKLMLAFCLITFVFFSIAVFCAMLSGHVITMPVIYVNLNFIFLWIWLLLDLLKSAFVFGYAPAGLPTPAKYLSPIVMLASDFVSMEYPSGNIANDLQSGDVLCHVDFQMVLIYTVCALLLLAASVVLYRKRRVECAGDILAFKGTSWIFQILLATGTGLLFTILLYSFFDFSVESRPYLFMALFLLGTPFGFFAGRMLIRKNFFIFKESAKGFAVFAACALLIMLSFKLDLYGISKKVPQAEEVESVTTENTLTELKNRENIENVIALHRQIVENRSQIEERNVHSADYNNWDYIGIEYKLKNGRRLSRSYHLPYEEKELSDSSSLITKIVTFSSSPVFTKAFYLTENFVPEDFTDVTYYDINSPYSDVPETDADDLSDDAYTEDADLAEHADDAGYEDIYSCSLSEKERTAVGYALLKDIETGNLKYNYYTSDAPAYYDQYLTCTVKNNDTRSRYTGSLDQTIPLNEAMTNTIQTLTDLGVINSQHPLTINNHPTGSYKKDPETYVIPDPELPEDEEIPAVPAN